MIDPYQDPFEEDEAAEEQRIADEAQEKAGFPVSFFGHLTEEEITIKKEEHEEMSEEIGRLWPQKKESPVGRRPRRAESERSEKE